MAIDVVVIGLGYVGLPLAKAASAVGLRVVGLDASASVVDGLNSARSHVDDLTDDDIAEMLRCGFQATTDASVLSSATAVVICVPTPLSIDGGPDLASVEMAVKQIRPRLRPGMLIVLESTTYPGTTDEMVRPILESSGLLAGTDFNLAFSPERIDPGNASYDISNTPKVVGGVTPQCTQAAALFYRKFVTSIVTAVGAREAELSKLLENTYRHVNIALVNEMARFCHEMEIDLWDVIRCAATKPFGFQAFYPGPGVGGHCIPIDPNYLSFKVRADLGYPFRFVELAQEINHSMPAYVVSRIQDMLNDRSQTLRGAEILLIGVTYKRDIADQRESPAKDVARRLISRGAEVVFHDPLVQEWSVDEFTVSRVSDLEASVASADVTVLLQNHSAYDFIELGEKARLLFDTRGVTRGSDVERL